MRIWHKETVKEKFERIKEFIKNNKDIEKEVTAKIDYYKELNYEEEIIADIIRNEILMFEKIRCTILEKLNLYENEIPYNAREVLL